MLFSLRRQTHEEDGAEGARWPVPVGLLMLAGSTGGIVLISEHLVENILPVVESTGVSQVFIGLILVPIFSNVVDHIVAISVAMKNKMDLSLAISIGSAAQVACLVLPVVVLIGYATGKFRGPDLLPDRAPIPRGRIVPYGPGASGRGEQLAGRRPVADLLSDPCRGALELLI